MSDPEMRRYIRVHGRRAVLQAVLEGLPAHEAAELFVNHSAHPFLIALSGEYRKEIKTPKVDSWEVTVGRGLDATGETARLLVRATWWISPLDEQPAPADLGHAAHPGHAS